jgi:hypothetical protein
VGDYAHPHRSQDCSEIYYKCTDFLFQLSSTCSLGKAAQSRKRWFALCGFHKCARPTFRFRMFLRSKIDPQGARKKRNFQELVFPELDFLLVQELVLQELVLPVLVQLPELVQHFVRERIPKWSPKCSHFGSQESELWPSQFRCEF